MVMALCVSAFAGLKSESWSLNPADFRYDMSLYFSLADNSLEDLEKYEIGAFVDDECRGVAEKLVLSETESCLYMRIRSNVANGEKIEFLLRNKVNGDTTIIKAKDGGDFIFKSDTRVGMPSDPFMMERFFNVSVSSNGNGSVKFSDGLYAAGSEINLTALPDEGYHLESWSNGMADASITITVDGDIALKASFAPNVYKVVFSIEEEQVAEIEVPFGASIEAPEAPAKVGYSFSGWTDLPEVMPAHDLEIFGSYVVNSYKLVLKIDNEEIYVAELEYEAPISLPEAPSKEGYSFNGWGDIPATMPAHDIEMHSSYSINSYKLTFELDGETLLSEDVVYGTSIVAPEVPVKEGYKFEGWTDLPANMPASDLTVAGSYSVNTYKIIFKIDGEEIFSKDLKFGDPVTTPEVPEKTGYTFNRWGDLPETMPAHDVEMHGSFTVNVYKLTFKLEGENIYSEDLAFGSSIVAPEVAEKVGYSFSGWGEIPAEMPAQNLEFIGEYKINKYNVTYKIDGEVAYKEEVEYGASVPSFTAGEKEGYEFSGFGEIPSVMPAKDLEFNGSYIASVFGITFRIDGNIISSDRLIYGAEIVVPEAPAKEGYSFTGWKNVPASMPARDVIVDGSYEINRYKVTYMVEEEEYASEEYEYGAPIVALPEPTKEGCSFSGWGDVPTTMPAFDLVFGGTFDENFYRVTFRIDGVVLFTDDFVYGASFTVPEAPAKEGYTFNGWGDVPTSMPAYNLEFDGSYTVNNYSVIFKIGEEIIYTGTLAYGSDIVAPEALAKDGYSFSGWGVVPSTMPATDLEIIGEYVVNSYNVSYRIGEEDFYTTQVPYGSKIEAPVAPEKEGHSFSGWSGIPDTMPANDIIVSGSYSVNNYALLFRVGDDVIYKGEIPYGTEIYVPEAPVKEGHTFMGWGMVPSTMPAADLDIVGAYEVNIYNLTYRIDGEDFFTTQLAYGSPLSVTEAPAKEGYSFLGWSDAVPTMPANDLVISGSYSLNSYNISFKIGDEVIFEGVLPYGSEIAAPTAPAKEGYTFAGWGMVPSTMPASDLEFNGAYDVNVYTLTFDIDGEVFYLTQLAYGTEITAPSEVPDKEGNSFGGWGDVPATMPANDLVISGTYALNNYTLTFKIGDEIIFTGQQPYGSEIVAPEAPVKEGYTFSGWGDVPAVVPAKNLEFIGEYTVNQYKLQFSVDGKEISSDLVAYGDPIVAPDVESKIGYTFSGWGVLPATMPASDLSFSGSFNINYYNVTFKVGEDVVYSAQVPYGAAVIDGLPEAPVKEGYNFDGWGDVPSSMPDCDLVFEGTYSARHYELTFMIGNDVLSTETVEYGAAIEAPVVQEKEGYTFTGWGVIPATMPASNLVISGSYEVNYYSVIFKLGEDIISSANVAYGGEISVPEVPEKEGNSFSGWGDIPSTMPASDLVFNGTYAVNSYNVVFRIGDEVLLSAKVEYGAEIVIPQAPEKEGYSFSGWGIVPATMPASDLEFSGVYDINYYNITFKINDEIAYTGQLAFGADIVLPVVPEQEGYTFSGWNDVPSTMPAHDLVFTATLTENGTVAVDEVSFGTDVVTVYSLDGVLLFKDVKSTELKDHLTPGIYIINGKKMVIR